MANPIDRWNALEKGDRAFLLGSILTPFAIWWYFSARHKYGTKGLK